MTLHLMVQIVASWIALCWGAGPLDDATPALSGPQPYPELTTHTAPRPLNAAAIVEDWGNYLGPRHEAVSLEAPLLKRWPAAGPTLLWEMKTGSGYAGPAVVGDRVVFCHRVGNEVAVDCLHIETGRRFWRFTYPSHYVDRYGFNNGPRCSPIIGGGRVYTHGAEGMLHALDLVTGKLLWRHDTNATYGIGSNYFGVGAAPLIEGNNLLVPVGAPGPGVVAYDLAGGKVAWTAPDDWGASYASPIPGVVHGKRRVFVFAGGDSRPPTGGLLSLDPADGKIDFKYAWRPRRYESVNAASPVVLGNRVFITTAYRKGGALVEVQPDMTHKELWTTLDLRAHWATPIHRDGYLYGFDGDGTSDTAVVCVDVKTGKSVWRKQLEWIDTITRSSKPEQISMGLMRGSMLWADGQFLALGEKGHLAWLDLSPRGCDLKARAWLFPADESFTLPIISQGLLFVTQNRPAMFGESPERLLCYDLRG